MLLMRHSNRFLKRANAIKIKLNCSQFKNHMYPIHIHIFWLYHTLLNFLYSLISKTLTLKIVFLIRMILRHDNSERQRVRKNCEVFLSQLDRLSTYRK